MPESAGRRSGAGSGGSPKPASRACCATRRAGQADRIVPVTADVAAFVDRSDLPDPDVVVVDPPRTGCGIEVMTALAATARSMIVYVACDPAALARDARVLVEAGWTLLQVRPFDLFPMTHHVEAVATFTRHD